MEELWVLVSAKYDEKLGHKVYVFDDPEDAILVQEFFWAHRGNGIIYIFGSKSRF